MDLRTTAKFDQAYRSLLVADVQRQLAQFFPARVFPEDDDLAYILSVATRLALSSNGGTTENADDGRRAYEVAVRSLNFANGSTPAVGEICDLILSRIGNFPARSLLHAQFQTSAERRDSFFSIETHVREFENKIRGTGSENVLTDFQVRLLRALETKKSVSVSAPTSAGKSFTLEIELLRRLRDDDSYIAVFMVPTRALIRQVTFDLVKMFHEHDLDSVPVISAPSLPDNVLNIKKLIYVLTQERLATLLTSTEVGLRVDAIVVDEAHEIGEAGRGQTLERVLSMVIARFPEASLFFSSPLRSNPEFLLRLFGREEGGEHFVEHLSPVTQNILNFHQVTGRGNTEVARAELVVENDVSSLGSIKLPFKFRGSYMGKFAFHFTNTDDTSIVYCNDPSTADKIAVEIAAEIAEEVNDSELTDLSTFLHQEVHPQYRLASLVRKGVAFHYGNIPQIIRGKIEELLRNRKLRFVCCTSTLLQGINLPAKNIFVENPRKGRNSPMKKGDFWNLAGRAGRLSHEYCGNVFCIFGKDWNIDAVSDRLVEIESAFDVAVKERTSELLQFVKEPPQSSESKESSWAEQAFARIYSDFVSSGKRVAEAAEEKIKHDLSQIDALAAGFKRTLPDQIFVDNFYVHPARLESIAAFLRQQDLLSWVPLAPYRPGSYQRLLAIFKLIEDLLIRSANQTYKYHAGLAYRWIKGDSLKQLIANKIEYSNEPKDADGINDAIRGLFEDLEKQLRYKYVKYTRVYGDVLRAVLIERGLTNEAETIPPLHLFLEYGASSKSLINLMAIGMSRTSALLFKSALSLRDDLSSAECQGYVNRVNLERTTLPALCQSEIKRLRRIRP